MRPDEIIRQLEAGRFDVEQALALFQQAAPPSGTSAAPATAPGDALLAPRRPHPIRRTGAGRVALVPLEVDAAPSFVAEPEAGPRVVRLTWPEPGIAVLAMEDREHQNMFTDELVRDLFDAFDEIRRAPDAKVVVIHGFDTWFCAGGVPHQLDSIRAGDVTFADSGGFFRLLLDCDLPTIAAVQGHALGGGFTFALYADLVVLAEHALYAGNFMAHGLTPGVGATHMFPLRLGHSLGTEMLWSARRFRGSELRDRGVQLPVVGRDEVIATAMERARELAAMKRQQLLLLKQRFRGQLLRVLPAVLDEELGMHRALFQTLPSSPTGG